MKIIHVTWSGAKAGMLHDIVIAQKSDHSLDIDILFCSDIDGYYARELIKRNFNVNSLGMKHKYGFYSNLLGLIELRKILKQSQYDIIHMQEIVMPFIFLGLRFLLPKAKLILHNRGEFSTQYEPLSKQVFMHFKKLLYPVLVNSFVDKLIVNSDFIKEKTRNLGVKPSKIEKLYNAIDIATIENEIKLKEDKLLQLNSEFEGFQRSFKIGVAARLVKLKRIDVLIRAFAKIKVPEKMLLIMGEGEEKNALKELTEQLKIENQVLFLGFRKDCKSIISTLDATALPSYEEAFGLSALESILLGVPVFVMVDGGGLKEFVLDGQNGFICFDANDFADKLNDFAERRVRFQSQETNEYKKIFSIVQYVRDIKRIYNYK